MARAPIAEDFLASGVSTHVWSLSGTVCRRGRHLRENSLHGAKWGTHWTRECVFNAEFWMKRFKQPAHVHCNGLSLAQPGQHTACQESKADVKNRYSWCVR